MAKRKIGINEVRRLIKQTIKETVDRDFTIQDFEKHLEEGPYAWPGGYPKYFITEDGGVLSFDSAKENKDEIIDAMKEGRDNKQWRVVAVEINWEDPDLYCDHSGEKIECAYCD